MLLQYFFCPKKGGDERRKGILTWKEKRGKNFATQRDGLETKCLAKEEEEEGISDISIPRTCTMLVRGKKKYKEDT